MTETARKILGDALALPERERLELAEALFESLTAEDQAHIDQAWRAEVLRRIAQVRSGEVRTESWDEVRQAGREALAQQ